MPISGSLSRANNGEGRWWGVNVNNIPIRDTDNINNIVLKWHFLQMNNSFRRLRKSIYTLLSTPWCITNSAEFHFVNSAARLPTLAPQDVNIRRMSRASETCSAIGRPSLQIPLASKVTNDPDGYFQVANATEPGTSPSDTTPTRDARIGLRRQTAPLSGMFSFFFFLSTRNVPTLMCTGTGETPGSSEIRHSGWGLNAE